MHKAIVISFAMAAILTSPVALVAQMCMPHRYVSLAEKIQFYEVVLLCQVLEPSVQVNVRNQHRTTIKHVMLDKSEQFATNQIFECECADRYHTGDLILLMGSRTNDRHQQIEWSVESEITPERYRYTINTPAPSEPIIQRILYLLTFVGSRDSEIARDAHSQLEELPLSEILSASEQFPTSVIRRHLAQKKDHRWHYHWYPLLLQHHGTHEDLLRLQEIIPQAINEPTAEPQRLIAGLLLLAPEEGADWLESTYINVPNPNFVHQYQILQSLYYVLDSVEDPSIRQRFLKIARALFQQKGISNLVISKMADWQDWSKAEKICKLYENVDKKNIALRGTITVYLLAYQHAHQQDKAPSNTSRLIDSQLNTIRQQSPNLYRLRYRTFEAIHNSESST